MIFNSFSGQMHWLCWQKWWPIAFVFVIEWDSPVNEKAFQFEFFFVSSIGQPGRDGKIYESPQIYDSPKIYDTGKMYAPSPGPKPRGKPVMPPTVPNFNQMPQDQSKKQNGKDQFFRFIGVRRCFRMASMLRWRSTSVVNLLFLYSSLNTLICLSSILV